MSVCKVKAGDRYGRLTVESVGGYRERPSGRGLLATCRCSCGATVQVATKELSSGKTRSCGCLRRCRRRVMAETPESVAQLLKERGVLDPTASNSAFNLAIDAATLQAMAGSGLVDGKASPAMARELADACMDLWELAFLVGVDILDEVDDRCFGIRSGRIDGW